MPVRNTPLAPTFAWLLLTLLTANVVAAPTQTTADQDAVSVPAAADSASAVARLREFLTEPRTARPPLAEQAFARVPLTKPDARQAAHLLRDDHRRAIRRKRAEEMRSRVLTHQDHHMPFFYKVFGEKPEGGRRLFISLHGGGGAPKQVNDSQWRNQQRLYAPEEGVYVAPRAPTDTWNLWHQGHIDPLLRRLIENLIVFEDVDPDRVYLLGYSAGGDGVYQLAPRMADSFAAASMMAGHPNETVPLGLRNLPFSLHVGGNDAAYNRNRIARQWKEQLERLGKEDPPGYLHWAKIYEGRGHWLNREDAAALPWMARFTRNRYPAKVVWKQDDVTHGRFYWLAVDEAHRQPRGEIVVQRRGQHIEVLRSDADMLRILLNDEFIDLDQPVVVREGDRMVHEAVVPRTIAVLAHTLRERGDPTYMFSSEIVVELPRTAPPDAGETSGDRESSQDGEARRDGETPREGPVRK